jgi:hypothetical protein
MASKLDKPENPNRAAANELWEMDNLVNSLTNPGSVIPMWQEGDGGTTGGYPAQFAALKDPPIVDKARVFQEVKNKYPDASGVGAPGVSFEFTKEDVAAMNAKKKMEILKEFQGWIGQTFDVSGSPADAQRLREIYPEMFEAMIQENAHLHDLQKKWTEMKIRGPQTKADLYLLWRYTKDPQLRNILSERIGFVNTDQAGPTRSYGEKNVGKWGWSIPLGKLSNTPIMASPGVYATAYDGLHIPRRAAGIPGLANWMGK